MKTGTVLSVNIKAECSYYFTVNALLKFIQANYLRRRNDYKTI